jgi:beta-mannanase
MAYLMTRHENWDQSTIRLLAVDDGSRTDLSIDSIKELLEEIRIEADPEIVREVDADTIADYSADSAMAFIPFRIKNNQIVDPFANPMENTLFLLPVTAMVLAAEDIELDAEPEEGKAGEMAEAVDALEDAQKKAQTAAKEAEKIAETAKKAKEKVEEMKANPEVVDSETLAAAEKEAEETEKQAVKMARKAAKAAAKVEAAAREAEASGVLSEEDQEEK